MTDNIFLADGVCRGAVIEYFKKSKESGINIHGLELYRGDELLIRLAPAPYSPADKRELYSLSKSFCSTAFGFCVDDGLVSLDTRVLDVFPDKAPEVISDRLDRLTFRHVISMNSGHEADSFGTVVKYAEDGVKAYLAIEHKYEPGTHFVYDTAATYIIGAAVERVTGEKLLDFLQRRFLTPAGIEGNTWHITNSGVPESGCGFHASVDDIASLGRLYLNKGTLNGKRFLSEKWVADATSAISDNSSNGSPDWCAGYGCQFWRNSREGFRGDGACGQLCVVLPESDIVAAQVAECFDMQKEIDLLFELKDNLFAPETATDEELENYLNTLYAEGAGEDLPLKNDGALYVCESNVCGLHTVKLCKEENNLRFVFTDENKTQSILAGRGEWIENSFRGKYMRPTLEMLADGREDEITVSACYRITEKGAEIIMRNRRCPHFMKYVFDIDDNGLTLSFDAFASFVIGEKKSIKGRKVT